MTRGRREVEKGGAVIETRISTHLLFREITQEGRSHCVLIGNDGQSVALEPGEASALIGNLSKFLYSYALEQRMREPP